MDIITHRLMMAAAGSSLPLTYSNTASSGSSSNVSTYTYTGLSIGTASASRNIIVITAGNAGTVNSITVGGVSATRVVEKIGNGYLCAMWQAKVPTGTTADVSITFSQSQSDNQVFLYAMYSNNLTVESTASSTTASSTSVPFSATVPQNGVTIFAATNQGDNRIITWSGATSRGKQSAGGIFELAVADTTADGSVSASVSYNSASAVTALQAVFTNRG